MIDADWERPREEPTQELLLRVAAVIPLPDEMGGAGEVLAQAAFGSAKLPSGAARPGEGLFAAAERIVLGATGALVNAERLVYVHEAVGREVTLCVLCALRGDDDPDPRPGVRFVSPGDADIAFEPTGVGALLVEDVRAGFVRPVAHVRVIRDEFGRERVESSW